MSNDLDYVFYIQLYVMRYLLDFDPYKEYRLELIGEDLYFISEEVFKQTPKQEINQNCTVKISCSNRGVVLLIKDSLGKLNSEKLKDYVLQNVSALYSMKKKLGLID